MQSYLTVGEFASRHGVTPMQVYKWLRQGRIPGVVRHGKMYAIPSDARRPRKRKVGRKPRRNPAAA